MNMLIYHNVLDLLNAIQIFARFRLVAAYNGNPNLFISRRIANDTGSSTQTIFVSDLVAL